MHQFSFQNPDVLIDFKERSSTDPAREDDADSEPVEPTGETAARELAQKEERRRKREKLVNQEEFVDVYFGESDRVCRACARLRWSLAQGRTCGPGREYGSNSRS